MNVNINNIVIPVIIIFLILSTIYLLRTYYFNDIFYFRPKYVTVNRQITPTFECPSNMIKSNKCPTCCDKPLFYVSAKTRRVVKIDTVSNFKKKLQK